MKYFYFIFFSFYHRFIYVSLFSSWIYSYRTEKYSDNEIVCNKDKYFFDFLFYFTFGCFMKIRNIKIDEKGWDIGKVVKVCYCWFHFFVTNKLCWGLNFKVSFFCSYCIMLFSVNIVLVTNPESFSRLPTQQHYMPRQWKIKIYINAKMLLKRDYL